MTFIIAFATRDLAFVAADTRGVALDTGAVFSDAIRKIWRGPNAWAAVAGHVYLGAIVARAAVDDSERIERVFRVLRPFLDHEMDGLSTDVQAYVRHGPGLDCWLVRDVDGRFVCSLVNPLTGVVTNGTFGRAMPGMQAAETEQRIASAVSHYEECVFQRLARMFDGEQLLRATIVALGQLFTIVRGLCEPQVVSDLLEIGVLARDATGSVRQFHVPPTSVAMLAQPGEPVERLLRSFAIAPDERPPQPVAMPPTLVAVTAGNLISTASIGLGVVTQATQAAQERCLVYFSIADNVNTAVPSGTWTALNFTQELFDIGGLHDNVTNNTRITIPTGGNAACWMLRARVAFTAHATGIRGVAIYKNGSLIASVVRTVVSAANAEIMECFWFENQPAVGDYFECFVFQSSGANMTIVAGYGNTEFSCVHLF